MLTSFFSAIGMGVAFCAPPGVVAAETIRRGIARGFWSALLVQFGSMIGDATWCLLALSGLAFLVQQPLLKFGLALVGLAILLYLTWNAWRDAFRKQAPQIRLDSAAPGTLGNDFRTGAALALSNPFNIVFWLGIGSSVVGNASTPPTISQFAIFFAGFMTGALLWSFVMALAVAYGRRFLTPMLFRVVDFLCGVLLLYFSVQLLSALF